MEKQIYNLRPNWGGIQWKNQILINFLEQCDRISPQLSKKVCRKNLPGAVPGMSVVLNDGLHYITYYILESNANFA